MLREVAETETDKKLRFKIVEKGGKTVERCLMRPNPIGDKHNICYKYKCNVCEEDVVYIRETRTGQVTEAVLIKNHTGELLKSEFYQPPLVIVRSEFI